jgi:hypothetical protein
MIRGEGNLLKEIFEGSSITQVDYGLHYHHPIPNLKMAIGRQPLLEKRTYLVQEGFPHAQMSIHIERVG